MAEPVRRLVAPRPAAPEPHAPQMPAPQMPARQPWPLLTGLLAAGILLYLLRFVLLPFVLGGAVALLGRPLMDRLAEGRGLPRWLTGSVIIMAFAAALALLAWWAVSIAASDLPRALESLPVLLRQLLRMLPDATVSLSGESWTADRLSASIIGGMHDLLMGDAVLGWVLSGLAIVFGLVLSVVIAAFLLVSGPSLAQGAIRLLPPPQRVTADELARIVAPMLRRYVLGVVLVVAFTSGTAWIAFRLVFGLEHATTLAIIVGMLEMVPVAGPIAAAALIALTALQQTSTTGVLALATFAILLRIAIDHLVGPLTLGRAVLINPVVVIFAFLAGGALFGILGVLLAVPAAASVKLGLAYLRGDHRPPERGRRS